MSQAVPKVSFSTLGCRLNQAESDLMAADGIEGRLLHVARGAP